MSDAKKVRQSVWRLPPKPDVTEEMHALGQVWVWLWSEPQLEPDLTDPWSLDIEPILSGRWEVRGTGAL